MKVKMLLKSGFGAIRCGEIFDVAPIDADAMALASREPPRPDGRPDARKSFADFCRAVAHRDSPYLARHYGSQLIVPETDHLSPREKAALAESGGPTSGYRPRRVRRRHDDRGRRERRQPPRCDHRPDAICCVSLVRELRSGTRGPRGTLPLPRILLT